MTEVRYFYQVIDSKHNPIFGNYYLLETDQQIVGFMVIGRTNDQLYLVKFMQLNKESQEVKSYVNGDLQANNEDFDWLVTKLLLQFLDELLNKSLVIKAIKSIAELNQQPIDVVVIYKLPLSAFSDVAFIKELNKQDMLEAVSKLLAMNQETNQLGDGPLVSDLTDSQHYLLDTIYDND